MTLQTSSWPHKDNKHYRGHLDRIFVSTTEEWEVGYFVDHYLEKRGFSKNDSNRDIVMQSISEYTGRKPILRDDLTKFLDGKIKSK